MLTGPGGHRMEANQIARMIEWLDEERRRDKATIAKLEERMVQQQEVIDTLNRRINGVECDQATLKTAFLPVGRDTDILTQLRTELQQAIEQVEAKRINAEREAERRTEATRDNVTRPMREFGD